MSYRFSDHAQEKMSRRKLSRNAVLSVLTNPGQVHTVRPGRKVFQSKVTQSDPQKIYLLRIFVDVNEEPPVVVTAYRTSKVEKYWK